MTIREYQKTLTGWRSFMVATCLLTVVGVGVLEITRHAALPAVFSLLNYTKAFSPF
mgnify:CR=1 FL=1